MHGVTYRSKGSNKMCGSIFMNVYKYHVAAALCGSDETADQARLSLWLD